MLISVIIPTFNRRDLLEQTLASVRSQAGTGCEVIVVDDGSTDGTLDFLAQQDFLTWFQQKNAGPSAARNLGAANANGDYLAFLDSDDLWFPWTLETYRRLIADSSAVFIAGKPFRFTDMKAVQEAQNAPLERNEFADYLDSGDAWRWWGCSSFVLRRDVFEAVGGFTSKRINAEDADLAMRLGAAGKFVQVTQPVTFAYREHEVSEMKNTGLNLKGVEHLLETQLAGRYPGGRARRREQWRIIARHLRPAALQALESRHRAFAWRIYRKTLPYHLLSGRWKFIFGFLLKAVS